MQNTVSGYGGLKAIAKKPDGGFCFIRVRSFLAAWIIFKRENISLFELRLFLACQELLARRCQFKGDRLPTYTEEELISLVGSGTKSKVKKGIQRLAAAGLLHWERNCISTDTAEAENKLEKSEDWLDALSLVKNNRRKMPVPRRILRNIIKTRDRTLIGTVFGCLFRCLYFRQGMCISGGRCKASFISKALRLNLRGVKAARGQLIQLGWIAPCDAGQMSLNRWGLPMIINLQWQMAEKAKELKITPPIAQNQAKVAPPLNQKLFYKKNNNQKLHRRSGVQNRTRVDFKPSLKNIRLEDLRKPERLERLFRRAVSAGVVPLSESSRLAWFSAAEHALQAGKQNPCGLFVAMYRQKLWHHITQDEEDRARAKLKRLDFGQDSLLPG